MDESRIPAHPAHRREWIKFQLRLRGTNLSIIARELGVSRQALRLALARPYPKMERAIAAKLDLSPAEIWPERYAARADARRDGKRQPSFHVKKPKHTPRRAAGKPPADDDSDN